MNNVKSYTFVQLFCGCYTINNLMLRNNYKIIYVYNIQYIFPMQILLTIKSIFRLKISYQMNQHFSTATYIFRHTHPYYIYRHRFQIKFFDNFSAMVRWFYPLIKCVGLCIIMSENFPSSEDIANFATILQHLTRFNKIRFVYCIHQDYSPKFEA